MDKEIYKDFGIVEVEMPVGYNVNAYNLIKDYMSKNGYDVINYDICNIEAVGKSDISNKEIVLFKFVSSRAATSERELYYKIEFYYKQTPLKMGKDEKLKNAAEQQYPFNNLSEGLKKQSLDLQQMFIANIKSQSAKDYHSQSVDVDEIRKEFYKFPDTSIKKVFDFFLPYLQPTNVSDVHNFVKQYHDFEEWKTVNEYHTKRSYKSDKDGITYLEYIKHFKSAEHSPLYITTYDLYQLFLNSKTK